MKSRKALSWTMAIAIIVGLFTLFLIISKSTDYIQNGNYASSILACKTMISQVDGKPQYFGKQIKDPNDILINLFATTCDAKQIELKENSVKPSLDLINDCWRKSYEGMNFFPAQLRDDGICLYCGSFEYEEGFENFKEELTKELNKEKNNILFESRGTTQLNDKVLIDSIPSLIEANKKYHIFYYIMRPNYEKNLGSYSSDFFGSLGGKFTQANYLFQTNDLETFSGVILTNSDKINSIISDAADSDVIEEQSSGNCRYIIPLKIHD